MYNPRNYAIAVQIVIEKKIKANGYFSFADVKDEYHPKFLAGLYEGCKTMATNGKLIYDAQAKQYKKP